MTEDWIEVEIGEICFTTSGGTPSRNNIEFYQGSIPWVKSGELDKGIIYDTEEHISEDAVKKSSAKIFPEGSLLIALYGATIGKLAFLGVEATTNQAICGIYKNEFIDSKYLYNFLLNRKQKLISQGTGGAQPNISQTILKKLEIPFAPLPIQRAIVSKIEALFSDLDNGIANFKKAQEQLKIYRQAVLKKAFDNDNKSYKIEKVCKAIFAGGDKPKKFFSIEKTDELTVPIYANAIPNNGLLGYTKEASVNEKAITIAARGSGTGHVELREKPFLPIVRLITIVPNLDIVHIKYLYCFLKNIDIKGGGSAIPQLTIPMVKQFQIHLPSIEEQTQIVQEIESRLSVCDKMEQSINESIIKAEALRQSILKKAFEGKLLSKAEIELCKKETDYEPASELLKKIQAEKLAKEQEKKKPKKK
ncbi:MAG: restriction endonuclease subunit S [Saprospiraceae bacterium]|jgi:type I restriction enzyme S subunit|nr:restriction endonuclease subunit S [Saprospiraceae bacterium]